MIPRKPPASQQKRITSRRGMNSTKRMRVRCQTLSEIMKAPKKGHVFTGTLRCPAHHCQLLQVQHGRGCKTIITDLLELRSILFFAREATIHIHGGVACTLEEAQYINT
jgi:hypothetical protein